MVESISCLVLPAWALCYNLVYSWLDGEKQGNSSQLCVFIMALYHIFSTFFIGREKNPVTIGGLAFFVWVFYHIYSKFLV